MIDEHGRIASTLEAGERAAVKGDRAGSERAEERCSNRGNRDRLRGAGDRTLMPITVFQVMGMPGHRREIPFAGPARGRSLPVAGESSSSRDCLLTGKEQAKPRLTKSK
jgi:hypothetical protein